MKKIIIITFVFLASCTPPPTKFSDKALASNFFSLDNKEITFQQILDTYKHKKIVIDIWASWCSDCIAGLSSVKKLQQEYKNVVFLFLSVDKSKAAWKNGIKRYHITGEHYFMSGGMKNGDFQDFVNISWIPRYMVIDETGKISLFKAFKATDSKIIEALK